MAKKKAKTPRLRVGDILVSTWGHEQTNVDFYEVVRLSDKSVWLVPLPKESVPGSDGPTGMSDQVVPVTGASTREPFRRLIRTNEVTGEPCVSITSFAGAWLWNGKPADRSWYA